MTKLNDGQPQEPQSFWHRRRPGIRYVYSAAGIVGGVVLAVRAANGLGDGAEGTWLFVGAMALIVLGIASIPVYRWMDKRRL